MLKNITRALALSLLVNTQVVAHDVSIESFDPLITEQMLDKYGTGFASLEHRYLGDSIQLHLINSTTTAQGYQFSLPNGVKLTYGELVMFAGDMFGNPEKPISNCSAADRLKCFQSQFNALGINGTRGDPRCTNPLNQTKVIKEYMSTIEKELAQAKQNGIEDWEYYRINDSKLTKDMNKVTCGGSVISSLIPFGNYIKLAQVNFDHFVPDSLTAYKTGHQFALHTAIEGYKKYQEGNPSEAGKLLELAYAQNAFANHYLTDSFSSGHMRTPRRAIDRDIALPAVLNLLIANLMHGEDNRNGLNVVNHEGTSWTAFGDGYLFKPESQVQREVLLDALQRSADGIYEAFVTGVMPNSYPEMKLLPIYSDIEKLNQTAPLFKVENGVLLKRVKNDDYYDHHWTKYWSGLTTLIEFKVSEYN